MSILTITNGLHANSEEIVQILGEKFNCRILTDADIIEKTHQTSGISLAALQKVMESRPIAFNDFTHEKEKCMSALKKTLSDFVCEANCIFHGVIAHLIPKTISHVMRVLIIAEKDQRVKNGMDKTNLSKKEATKEIELSDKHAFLWTQSLFNKKAWDKSLYDILIPSGKLDTKEAVELVSKHLNKLPFTHEDLIKQEVFDFKLTADVELALSNIGQGLLVDDEKEFVQTLSERLRMRQFASEIAYNGQEALDFTDQEDTEVILLDLKMPGIDGFEVLKRIKKTKPHIEVIILTGHGSEADRKTCMDLGAFAYLQKPADIDLITQTMKKAYEKIETEKNNGAPLPVS
jgi:two-component system response regulator CpxR